MRVALTVLILLSVKTGFCVDRNDSLTISQLNARAYKYFLFKPDSSIFFANQAIALAERSGYPFLAGRGYYILSKANWAKANYLSSIHYGFKALKIFENTNRIFEWGECNLAIGRTFGELRNYNLSKTYIEQAISLAHRYDNSDLLAESFREKSFLLVIQKQYDSALYFSNKGIEYYQLQGDTLNTSILYGRITRIFFESKEYKKCLSYCLKSIVMDSLSGNRRALGISYFQLGQIYFAVNKKDSALIALRKSIPITGSIRNLSTLIKAHQLLATIYEERKQLANAAIHLKLSSQYKDSLYNLEENGQIQELLSNYELASKEKTIQSLEMQNALEKQKHRNSQLAVILISVAAGLLATLSIVFWRMRQWQVKEAKTLKEVSQLKSKLFSVISHDLRGPINNLQSLLEMVTKEYVTQEEFKNISVKLKSSLNISQNTLENLLNWSLSQMEGIRTQKTQFNITPVVIEVTQLIEEIASRKKISVEYKSDGAIMVNADVNQVNLILRNVLHNAIKFSRHNSTISIKTSSSDGYCRVSVRDTGLGMTTEEISTVLNSNEYFTKSGTDREKGTGLGFILVKDFVKRNGGEIIVKSELGQGTDVTFTLQLA